MPSNSWELLFIVLELIVTDWMNTSETGARSLSLSLRLSASPYLNPDSAKPIRIWKPVVCTAINFRYRVRRHYIRNCVYWLCILGWRRSGDGTQKLLLDYWSHAPTSTSVYISVTSTNINIIIHDSTFGHDWNKTIVSWESLMQSY